MIGSARPMFPLQSTQLPGDTLPLRIFEPRYARLVQDCLAAEEPVFGVVLISRGLEVGGGDTRSDVGALARIDECAETGEGSYELIATVGERIRVTDWLPDDPYPRALVETWTDEPGPAVGPEQIGVVVDRILALYERVAQARGLRLRPGTLAVDPETADDPARHLRRRDESAHMQHGGDHHVIGPLHIDRGLQIPVVVIDLENGLARIDRRAIDERT